MYGALIGVSGMFCNFLVANLFGPAFFFCRVVHPDLRLGWMGYVYFWFYLVSKIIFPRCLMTRKWLHGAYNKPLKGWQPCALHSGFPGRRFQPEWQHPHWTNMARQCALIFCDRHGIDASDAINIWYFSRRHSCESFGKASWRRCIKQAMSLRAICGSHRAPSTCWGQNIRRQDIPVTRLLKHFQFCLTDPMNLGNDFSFRKRFNKSVFISERNKYLFVKNEKAGKLPYRLIIF